MVGDTACCGLVKSDCWLRRGRVGGEVVRFLWGGGVRELVVERESGWWTGGLVKF